MTKTCRFCGEEIVRDEHGLWHHASDDAVVCGTVPGDGEGGVVWQYASPSEEDEDYEAGGSWDLPWGASPGEENEEMGK